MAPGQDNAVKRSDVPVLDLDYHAGGFVSADLTERMDAWNGVRGRCPVSWNERDGGFWLLADYLPAVAAVDSAMAVTVDQLTSLLPGAVVTRARGGTALRRVWCSHGGGGPAWRLLLRRDRGLSQFRSRRPRAKASDRLKPQRRCQLGSDAA